MAITDKKHGRLQYRVIALDLDGTLTNNQKEVTAATTEALDNAMEQGARLVLASGRPVYGIVPVAKSLALDTKGGYILAYNGGQIIDCKTNEVLYSQYLPSDVIPLLYEYAKSKGYALLGYKGNEIITESPDDIYVREESRINKMNVRKVDMLTDELDAKPTKLLMTGDPKDMLKAEEELREAVKDRIDV